LIVLLVNTSIDPVSGGGTATRTVQLARSIKKDFEVECIILTTDQGLDETSKQQYSELKTVILPCLNDRFYIPYFSWAKLKELVEKIDVIHLMSHWSIINAIVYLLARQLDKPYTFCPAGSLHIFGRSALLKNIYNLFIGKSLIKNASQCIAITNLEKKDFLGFNVQEELISVIPNGIDGNEFCPNPEASNAFKNRFGLQRVPYILFMGRLNLIKGPDILLKAYIRLSLEFPTLHLVFAGPDEGLGDQLRKKIKKESLENRIHLIGYIEGYDKVGAYTGAEFLVVPSRREAMSIVALEAGACGTPVILSTECGFDEVKEVGCKVVQPIADELYNGMNSMLSSSKSLKALGNDLRNLILERYTWKKSAEQYLKFLP
jgi:glycosyltransferase involved in cell wall biosynthesis